MNLPGNMGPTAEVVETNGAKHSKVPGAFNLLPPLSIALIAQVLEDGAKRKGEWSWLNHEPELHLNHALGHVTALIAGDTQEGDPEHHASHATCRLLFALEGILARKAAGKPWRSSYDIAASALVERLRAGEPRKEDT